MIISTMIKTGEKLKNSKKKKKVHKTRKTKIAKPNL